MRQGLLMEGDEIIGLMVVSVDGDLMLQDQTNLVQVPEDQLVSKGPDGWLVEIVDMDQPAASSEQHSEHVLEAIQGLRT